ncbi:SNF2-related protein [Actinomycetota bacterium]
MKDSEEHLRVIAAVREWVAQATTLERERRKLEEAAEAARSELTGRVVSFVHQERVVWRAIPLSKADVPHLSALAGNRRLAPLSELAEIAIGRLTNDVALAVSHASSGRGFARLFQSAKKRQQAQEASSFLAAFHDWGQQTGVSHALERAKEDLEVAHHQVPLHAALGPEVGLVAALDAPSEGHEVLPTEYVSAVASALTAAQNQAQVEQRHRARAVQHGNQVRQAEVRVLLQNMPVAGLREATRERIRVKPLTDAGLRTVLSVIDAGGRIEQLPGIGPMTANHVRGAARTIWQTTYDDMPVRLDVSKRSPESTALLGALADWDRARQAARTASPYRPLLLQRQGVIKSAAQNKQALALIAAGEDASTFREAAQEVLDLAGVRPGGNLSHADPWDDFLQRPANYFAMLSELGLMVEDEKKVEGDLPKEILQSIRDLELNTRRLSASLRGYQSFGARFAIVQRKVIIGDEMGLGKTVEALAVMAHLHEFGVQRSLVICPAAVVSNWTREISAKSTLQAHRLHGPNRDRAARDWMRAGGVAVTTFESLDWLGLYMQKQTPPRCVIERTPCSVNWSVSDAWE